MASIAGRETLHLIFVELCIKMFFRLGYHEVEQTNLVNPTGNFFSWVLLI